MNRQAAPAFQAETLTGQTIHFPTDYRGKLVLLDFWATWCTPCRAEQSNVGKAYEKFHSRGLEVLGISLDAFQHVPASRVAEFVQAQKLNWPQIYTDAQAIAAKYGIAAIPAAFLIDGNTGAVIASGDDLHSDRLAATLEKHLAALAHR